MKSNHNLFEFDEQQTCKILIGTDEAGRGPAAGGVFASAVYINNKDIEKDLGKLNDSKKLTPKVRDELFDIILNNTINSTVCIEVEEIEKTNILACSLKAMKLACENVISQLKIHDSILTIVDGNQLIRNYDYPQLCVKKGDATSASIAAASILAKVTRDRYMEKLDEEYPQYGWAKNAGYLTKEHSEAILKYGITKYHRKSFLKNLLSETKQLSLL
ncbi:ribonuclease HII [bacterium]|nr:ribonuclease HII [bacterium]